MAAQSKLMTLSWLIQTYNPDQPRIPAGNSCAGRWAGNQNPARHHVSDDNRPRLAQNYSWGDLVAEIPNSAGRDCIYRFDFGLVKVPGPTNLRCIQRTPSATVTHGQLLNDNCEK
jgi:hypothetical protein